MLKDSNDFSVYSHSSFVDVHIIGIEFAYLREPHLFLGLTGFDSKPKVDVSMSSAEGAAR